MKPYSKDLRLRVLSAVEAGKPREEVAKTFSVSMPTIKRWLKSRLIGPGLYGAQAL
jgi:transposase